MVVYTSKNCGPCVKYKQELAGIDGIEIVDVDDPANVERAISDQVWQVPTSILPDGTRFVGWRGREEVMGLLG